MNHKVGGNDPCTCGSGKKYKQCCMQKASSGAGGKQKITAKWLNAPQGPNLMERTFGDAISSVGKAYKPPEKEKPQEGAEKKEE